MINIEQREMYKPEGLFCGIYSRLNGGAQKSKNVIVAYLILRLHEFLTVTFS